MRVEIGNQEIEVTMTEYRILRLLRKNRAPMYGLEIVKESMGAVPRGTIYVMLQRMGAKGFLVSSTRVPDKSERLATRTVYEPSRIGRVVMKLVKEGKALGRTKKSKKTKKQLLRDGPSDFEDPNWLGTDHIPSRKKR